MNKVIPIEKVPHRECGECTACCEGWLQGEAYGHKFYKGTPCYFLQKSCTIYDNRPEDPCKNYKCTWLGDTILPMWMRPDMSGVIVTRREFRESFYFIISNTKKDLNSRVLNFLIIWSLNNNYNIQYWIDGGEYRIGSNEFLEAKL